MTPEQRAIKNVGKQVSCYRIFWFGQLCPKRKKEPADKALFPRFYLGSAL